MSRRPDGHDRRDLRGDWARDPIAPPWPDGRRLAVSFVVNVEEGAELSIGDGDERNESVYEIREAVETGPDLCMESHFAYGPRRGYRRIVAAFAKHGVRATFSTCGRAAERLPWLIADAASRGHEISCHGWRWERHAQMRPDVEAAIIARTHAAIETAAGVAPVGWHTRSAPSARTRELLVAHGGFLYDSDCYDDDQPRIEDVGGRAHVVLPYAFDTNDMRFSPGGGFVQADDFTTYVAGAFRRLLREAEHEARMLSVGLHLRLIGRPGRIAGLENLLRIMAAERGVWFATRAEIARAWRDATAASPR
ncbi:chitin deacetylase [Aureimonas flava]|uniref:Chitooligosaccharide deacetylase n=1 Tax=Aureimonas flava TaxID=2320271 RepID=A0A3A1WF33_9HYPH|nr:polysaccharide deacetylase family protein [Aureimonas flava]RIX98188.1 chitin deacetylase [Aureimonas flava]